MKVDELMSSPVLAVRPVDPIAHAKNLMLRHKVKHLIVVEQGAPVGVLSMRDIAKAIGKGSATWRRRPVDPIPVARVMRKEIKSVSVGTDVKKAADQMLKHNIGCLIVQDGEKLVGVITKTDLVRNCSKLLNEEIKVSELMTRDLVTVNRTHSLTHVAGLMEKHKVGRVIVVEGDVISGIITEGDITFAQLEQPAEGIKEREVKYTRRLERAGRPRARYLKRKALLTAGDVMRTNVWTIEADKRVVEAAAKMIENGISGLPVTEGGKLVGIITKTDIVRGIASLGV